MTNDFDWDNLLRATRDSEDVGDEPEEEVDEWTARLDALGIPDALSKAMGDPFVYALGLRNGQVIAFESARLSNDGLWVHLTPYDGYGLQVHSDGSCYPMTGVTMPFERGLDVRLSEIIWVADAPWGS